MEKLDLPKALIFSSTIGQVTGYTRRYLLKLEQLGRFPKRIHLGARRVA